MGPSLEQSLRVTTATGASSRLQSPRTQQVPLNLLSRTMQLMHKQGLSVVSVEASAPATTPSDSPSEAEADNNKSRSGGKRRRRGKN